MQRMRQEQQLQKLRARQEKQHAAQTKKEETTSLLPSLEVEKIPEHAHHNRDLFRLLPIFVLKKKYQLLPSGSQSPPYLTPPSSCPGWRRGTPGPGCSELYQYCVPVPVPSFGVFMKMLGRGHQDYQGGCFNNIVDTFMYLLSFMQNKVQVDTEQKVLFKGIKHLNQIFL